MSDASFPLEFGSKGRGAPFGLADLLPLLGPLSRSPVLLLLLLLLLYVLPRSRGTGPLVLGGSALLLDEPASAGLICCRRRVRVCELPIHVFK